MKALRALIDPYSVISIIGNAKNAGKTTVLNTVIDHYYHQPLAVTSIGLDGEQIDNVTFLPKPRIFVYENMIVATASECLKSIEAKYEVIETTSISSALGPITLIRITQSGNCLIGGPSTSMEMEQIIQKFKSMNVGKILIDGAFARKTVTTSSDACIFVVGASGSSSMDSVIEHANESLLQFQFSKTNRSILPSYNRICFMDAKGEHFLDYDTIFGHEDDLLNQMDSSVECVYVPGALTASFIKKIIQKQKNNHLEWVIKSPTHFIADTRVMKLLHQFNQKITVIQPINLIALMYNPYSPLGYEFDDSIFSNRLKSICNLPIMNVKKETENDNYE